MLLRALLLLKALQSQVEVALAGAQSLQSLHSIWFNIIIMVMIITAVQQRRGRGQGQGMPGVAAMVLVLVVGMQMMGVRGVKQKLWVL